jgi:hypothetical protein
LGRRKGGSKDWVFSLKTLKKYLTNGKKSDKLMRFFPFNRPANFITYNLLK